MIVLGGLLVLGLSGGSARADKLVVSVSQQKVRITSGFSGAELVIFGVAETDGPADTVPDVVVSVRGPSQTFTTWRKARVLGLWLNSDSRTFREVPSFLHVISSRPPEEMAEADTLQAEQIGLARTRLEPHIGADPADKRPTEPFRAAFLRIQEAQGAYREKLRGVGFIAPHVFRAEIGIPGTAPLGRYVIEVKMFRGGELMASASSTFHVQKVGFELTMAEFARSNGLLYGMFTAIGSLIVGFVGSALFKKD